MCNHHSGDVCPQGRRPLDVIFRANWGKFLLSTGLLFTSMTGQTQILFQDVTDAAGVSYINESYGASWGDLNGDAYPDLFLSNHRLQPSLFLNRGDGRFFNTATQVFSWINRPRADTHGAGWSDFDNDGDQDLLVSTGTGNPSHFLVNERGALIDRTTELGIVFDNVGGRLPIWFDYNGDQLPDFVMTQMGGIAKLMEQTATGFVEKTGDVQLNCKRFHYGQLFDVNGSGRLDFVCPDETVFPQKIYDTLPLPWSNITSAMPIVEKVPDTIIADFDNDLRMDMFFISGQQLRPSGVQQEGDFLIEAQLTGGEKGFNFISNGAITFDINWNKLDDGFGLPRILIGSTAWNPGAVPFTLDPADPSVLGTPAPVAVEDAPVIRIGYDDVSQRWTVIHQTEGVWSNAYFITTSTAPISDLNTTGLWGSDHPAPPTLLSNTTTGFSDTTITAGLDAAIQCVSATAGDYDNDMDVDLYLACRTGVSNIENILYENQGDGSFLAVAGAGGAAGPVGTAITSGSGTADTVVGADYDVDGFIDLFVTNGFNMRPVETGGPSKLFRNQGNSNHWIELDLVGTLTERDAVGTRVIATANGISQLRVHNGGYHRWAQEHNRIHFGLANATTVDLTVEWPSGAVESFTNISADQLYRITEGSGLAVVTPGDALPYPCGAPTYDGNVDAGVFLWKECATGEWQMRMLSGGTTLTYVGTVTSSSAFSQVTPKSVESGDTLDFTSNPSQISFSLTMSGSGEDGAEFLPASGANTCFSLDLPAGASVYLGPMRVPVSQPLDLETVGVCTGIAPELSVSPITVDESATTADFTVTLSADPANVVTVDVGTSDGSATAGEDYTTLNTSLSFNPGDPLSQTVSVSLLDDSLAEGLEDFILSLSNPVNATLSPLGSQASATITDDEASPCGTPTYDAATEAGVFLWQDCSTGNWYMRVTAGGGSVAYSGHFISDQAFSSVTAYSLESSDVLDTSDPLQISYLMNVSTQWDDGVNFSFPAGANACFTLESPMAAVYLGSSRTPMSTSFDLSTLGACSGLPPQISISDITVLETDASADFTLSLSAASSNTVTVDVNTQDGTALAGSDYTGLASTTVSFLPGDPLSQTISVVLMDDALSEGDEDFHLQLSNPVNATLTMTQASATITDDEVSSCGEPAYDPGVTAAAFVWRDCTTGKWYTRFTAGGGSLTYTGSVSADAAYLSVEPFSLESSDILDSSTDPSIINFTLKMGTVYQDGFNFTLPTGNSACFAIDTPTDAVARVGASATPVALPFRLDTLGPCP